MPDNVYVVTESDLTSIANAIRTKGGTSASLTFPTGFTSAIGNIMAGFDYEAGTFTLTENERAVVVPFTKQHSVPPTFYAVVYTDTTIPDDYTQCSEVQFSIYDWLGHGLPRMSSQYHYGVRGVLNKATASVGTLTPPMTSNPETAALTDYANIRMYAREDGLYLGNFGETSNYRYRANKPYSWIAIWLPPPTL